MGDPWGLCIKLSQILLEATNAARSYKLSSNQPNQYFNGWPLRAVCQTKSSVVNDKNSSILNFLCLVVPISQDHWERPRLWFKLFWLQKAGKILFLLLVRIYELYIYMFLCVCIYTHKLLGSIWREKSVIQSWNVAKLVCWLGSVTCHVGYLMPNPIYT